MLFQYVTNIKLSINEIFDIFYTKPLISGGHVNVHWPHVKCSISYVAVGYCNELHR